MLVIMINHEESHAEQAGKYAEKETQIPRQRRQGAADGRQEQKRRGKHVIPAGPSYVPGIGLGSSMEIIKGLHDKAIYEFRL